MKLLFVVDPISGGDGKFELVLVTKISSSSLIKAGLSKFNDSFYDNQSGQVISTTYAEIEFEESRLLQLDGEVIGKFEKIKVEMMKGAVRLITQGGNKYVV